MGLEAAVNNFGQYLFVNLHIYFQFKVIINGFTFHKAHILRQDLVEDETANGAFHQSGVTFTAYFLGGADFNLGVKLNIVVKIRHFQLVHIAENRTGSLGVFFVKRHIIGTEDHIL